MKTSKKKTQRRVSGPTMNDVEEGVQMRTLVETMVAIGQYLVSEKRAELGVVAGAMMMAMAMMIDGDHDREEHVRRFANEMISFLYRHPGYTNATQPQPQTH